MAFNSHIRRVSALIATTVSVVLALLVSTITPASATPKPSIDEVMTKLNELSHRAEQLTEQYNKANEEVQAKKASAHKAEQHATAAQKAFYAASGSLRVSLVEEYRGSQFNATAALMNSQSGQQYIDRLGMQAAISRHRSGVANQTAAKQHEAAAAKRSAEHLLSDAKRKLAKLTAAKKAVQAQQAKFQSLLNTLTAQQRRTYFNNGGQPGKRTAAVPAKWTPVPAPSKKAAVAVAFALAQRGKPYVWGAAGPSTYDCSGLTMAAWAQAGVHLAHYAPTQMSEGHPISMSQLQPGDLVFFYPGIQHVAMYIGNGMVVHAPQSGDVVKIVPLSYMSGDAQGARRYG